MLRHDGIGCDSRPVPGAWDGCGVPCRDVGLVPLATWVSASRMSLRREEAATTSVSAARRQRRRGSPHRRCRSPPRRPRRGNDVGRRTEDVGLRHEEAATTWVSASKMSASYRERCRPPAAKRQRGCRSRACEPHLRSPARRLRVVKIPTRGRFWRGFAREINVHNLHTFSRRSDRPQRPMVHHDPHEPSSP